MQCVFYNGCEHESVTRRIVLFNFNDNGNPTNKAPSLGSQGHLRIMPSLKLLYCSYLFGVDVVLDDRIAIMHVASTTLPNRINAGVAIAVASSGGAVTALVVDVETD